MHEFLLKTEKETAEAARWFIPLIKQHKIFAIYGEMGAGKTTLIKAICRELKVAETVSSPTFALVYEYHSPEKGIIYHFDLYRIKELTELFDLGYEDYVYSGNLCFIEWPEIAGELLPPETVKVKIEVNPDNSRTITLLYPEK
jgi:tRNA threonylcarbamoyladenosine biosynthesis protein TsaE